MIINTGGTGSGASLRAIAVASENALPASARDGTIAVVTNTAVSAVYAQNTEPSSPKNGDVWITVSSISTTPIVLGKITLYPAQYKQYVGNAWENVTAFVRCNGVWVQSVMYLLDGASDNVTWQTYYAYGGKAEKVTNGYKFTGANGGNQPGAIQTAEKVDITGFSKLRCVGRNDNTMTQNFPFFIGIQRNQAYSSSNSYNGVYVITQGSAAYKTYSQAGDFDLTVDISQYSGEYYIGCSSAHENTVINRIWLEV